MKIKYLSTFTGIGGFELGIGDAGECVGFSEIDKYAVTIYKKHFPEHHNYGDIAQIAADALPDFDLFVGGFPCQSFSIAGKRGGFNDVRGTLFFEICRILRAKHPRLLLLENVKGLLSHDEGRTFETIIRTLDELGYDLQWQVLNSKDFGVPQNRERVFIVGHSRGTPRPKVFPFGESHQFSDEKSHRQTQATHPIRAGYKAGQGGNDYVAVGTLRTHKAGQGFREIKSGLAPTIPARAREDGSGQPVILSPQPTYGKGKERRVDFKKQDISPAIRSTQFKGGDNQPLILQKSPDFRKEGKLQEFSEYSPTIRADMGDNHPMVAEEIRICRLTPKECERLQGFPDDWTAGISDTQRYKCLGNAVTVNVIRAIAQRML